jgi:AspT/YidE/YbjL antiporter-like protein
VASEAHRGPDVAIIRVLRAKAVIDPTTDPVLHTDDQVLVVSKRSELLQRVETIVGSEIASRVGQAALGESVNAVVTNKRLKHKTLAEIADVFPKESFHGIHLASITRTGQTVPILPGTDIHTGDTLRLVGLADHTETLVKLIGYCEKPSDATDYVWLSAGVIVGILIGLVKIPIGAGVRIALETSGGCMVAGLLFGYLRSLHPTFGQLPSSTADFMKNFGLIAFIAVVGLSAGPKAFVTIQQQGWTLMYLGAIVTIVPIVAAQLFGAYVLRGDLKNSQLLAGSIAGGRSCTAALGSVMTASGSNAAMLTYPVTYTIAQVYLTLFGPVIVAIMSSWGPWAVTLAK